MKKKYFVTAKDKKDWTVFTKQMGNIQPKPSDILSENNETKKEPKLDLHGASLSKSNEMVRNFITLESTPKFFLKLLKLVVQLQPRRKFRSLMSHH